MSRDFTYIDDIVDGILRVTFAPLKRPIYNIGNHTPVQLTYMIELLENLMGKKAQKNLLPMQPGDVPATYADIDAIQRDLGFQPSTTIDQGVPRFVAWYRDYHGV